MKSRRQPILLFIILVIAIIPLIFIALVFIEIINDPYNQLVSRIDDITPRYEHYYSLIPALGHDNQILYQRKTLPWVSSQYPTCIRGSGSKIFGTNKDYAAIMEEFGALLLGEGWTVVDRFRETYGRMTYETQEKDSRIILDHEIHDSFLDNIPPHNFQTTYIISYRYTYPALGSCNV